MEDLLNSFIIEESKDEESFNLERLEENYDDEELTNEEMFGLGIY